MHRGNRHGRSEEARVSVLEAADDLLAEKGFAQLTIEGIAQRAGVAKQTIYRWWSSKTEILLDAFLTDAAEDLNPPDADPRAYLRRLAAFLTRSDAGLVFRALMAEGQHDPALAERLRTEYLAKQKAGYLARHKEHDGTLFDRLVGPVYYRALVTGEEITDEFIDELVTATLPPASRA
jgi:AcrR family transcriptional regulator